MDLRIAEEASRRLAAAGFQKLSERQEWSLKPGGRYYFTRNLSTVVAFAVGAKYQPGNGLHMIGAHTDRSATEWQAYLTDAVYCDLPTAAPSHRRQTVLARRAVPACIIYITGPAIASGHLLQRLL